jgi:hypothetical protein
VRELALAVQHVHGDDDGAELDGGEERFEEADAVGEEEGEPVSGFEAARAQLQRHAVAAGVELPEGEGAQRAVLVGIHGRVVAPRLERQREEVAEVHGA